MTNITITFERREGGVEGDLILCPSLSIASSTSGVHTYQYMLCIASIVQWTHVHNVQNIRTYNMLLLLHPYTRPRKSHALVLCHMINAFHTLMILPSFLTTHQTISNVLRKQTGSKFRTDLATLLMPGPGLCLHILLNDG